MKSASEKYLKSAGLEELMRVNDNGKNIKILVKSGTKDSQIKELLMFIEGSAKGNQTVLMSLTGDFDINEISTLTNRMNIPGGDACANSLNNVKNFSIYTPNWGEVYGKVIDPTWNTKLLEGKITAKEFVATLKTETDGKL